MRKVTHRPLPPCPFLFFLLPLATLAATLALDPNPAIEAAMVLVTCYPGGAVSNVIPHFGHGTLALLWGRTDKANSSKEIAHA